MSHDVRIQPAAAREIDKAFAWYESQRTGLGSDFLRAIAMARDELVRDPKRFPETRSPFRWVKMRRFPYGIHYRIQGANVLIVSCLHYRQSAERWPGA